MADKEFQVRHGLIVNNTVLVANSITNNVGIGRANPGYALDVVGTANASNLLINGNPVSLASATGAAFSAANAAFAQANTVSSDADEKANAAIITANAAFNKANAALANSTGTFAGDLTVTGNVIINGNQGITVRESDVGFYYDSVSAGALELTHTNDASGNYFEFLTTDAASQLRITTAGNNIVMLPGQNFGVGTSTPAVKLDVEGRANVSTALTVAGMNVVPTIQTSFDKANSANLLAFNTGSGANAYASGVGSNANLFATAATVAANNYAGVMANAANNFANNKFLANSTGTFQGALTVTDFVKASRLESTNSTGDEGGEITLATAQTNNNLSTSVTIDIYQNKLRFFETGNTNRGAFIDLSLATSGVGSDLLSSGGTDTVARAAAGAAFDKANAANSLAFNTGSGANAYASGVGSNANLFTSATIAGANTAVGGGANAFTSATISGANTAVGTGANSFATMATIAANNYAGVMANAVNAYMISTVSGANTIASSAFDKANAANVLAFNTGTGANAFTSIAFDAANAAFAQANSVSSDADEKANAAIITANLAFDKANSANIVASNAYDKANAANVLAFNALPNTTATFNGTLTVNNDIIVRGNATLGDANTDTITINGNSITLGNNQNIDAGTLFIDAVNNRVGINTTSFTTSPTAGLEIRKQGAGWYHNSTSHGGLYTEFTTPAGGGSIFTIRTDNGGPQLRLITSGNSIVMLPATGFVGIGATLPTSNLHVIGNTNITSSLIVATINVIPAIASAYDQANAANLLAFNTGIGANAYASGVGSNANLFASATIAGANTAVGAGANAFTSATIAGANTAVGTGANAFATSATIAANNYAGVMANASNAYADTKLANTTGATFQGNLNVTGNLVANTLVSNAGFIDLGPGSRPANVEGRIYYDNIDKVLTVVNESDFKISVGQTEYARVYNDSGSTLLKGQAVYATGFHTETHHHFTVDLADASDVNKYDVIGLVAADIPNASHGYVIVRGWLGGINTSSLTAGTRFHLGYATPGSLVTVSPEYPNYPYDIGYCIVANNTNGYLYVDRQTHTIEALRVTNSARVGGDMTVEGNFTVLGSENAITVNSLEVGTQFIYLGSGDSIPNSAVYFVGSGLNDIDFQGHYTGNANTSYYVMISDVSPDKFSWGYNSDFSNLVQANVVMQYQTAQPLSNGISVYFNANTGHTVGDKWNATAFGVSTDFGIVGNHIDGPNGYTHAGLFRDATDGTFKFFRSYNPEVNGNIDIANTSFALANVQVNRITAAEVYEGGSQISAAIAGAYVAANGAFDKANSANLLAFNTGSGANAFASATIAGANLAVGTGANAYAAVVGTSANAFASATIAGANTAVGTGANAYAAIVGTSANAFTSATIAGANTAVGTGANAYAAVVGTSANAFTSATIAGANTAVGTGANAYAAVVGTSANAFTSATIAGANVAVGTGANAYATVVGTSANAFTSATIAGANTAVGTGANAFTSATIAGANTAVGTGANAFTSATIAGANTAVGTGANAFASATIAGANTAVGAGANSVGIAAFARANASVNVINIGGTITLTSNSTAINVVSSNGVTLAANNFAGVATLNIGLSTTGVTATTYGASDTIIPRITVDAYGRITGASNITVANATLVAISSNNYAGQMANAANAFMSSTVAGANAAVGSAANNFAGVMANAANAFMITVQNGSNTAVGTGANTFASGVGSNANLFASATIAGANAAVGAGANSVGIAAFARANASINVINVGGTINLTSNSTSINIVASNGISLVANNFAGIARLNIGLTLSGVTATTYGGATFIPAITVDSYGRITSAANIGLSVGGGGYYQGNSGNVGTTLGLGDIFRVHSNVLTENVTIVTGNNALAAGPITVATNRTLTIQTGARVSIV